MSAREWGNPPLLSTTAPTTNNPSTATLCAQLIIPVVTDSNTFGRYEVRLGLGAGSTGALWRFDVAVSTSLSTTALRNNTYGVGQRFNFYTGTAQTSEFQVTVMAKPGDLMRVNVESTFTSLVQAWIQAEELS